MENHYFDIISVLNVIKLLYFMKINLEPIHSLLKIISFVPWK